MKPPLLLLSGLLCEGAIWADIPQRLADVADVTPVSFRGFSSITAMSKHVQQIAPPRFALAGHSMGGRVALEVVRAAAHRVNGLALLNTSVAPVRGGEAQSRQALLRLACEHGMSALAAEWLPPMLGSNAVRSAAVFEVLRAVIKRWTAQEFAGHLRAMLRRPDAMSVLSQVHVPTLLLSGSYDSTAAISQPATIRRRVPHATLFEVHGAGHMCPIERPDAVALALREWLGQLR